MFNFIPSGIRSSSISNPLSAITESPGSNTSRIPDLQVSSLSDMEPENNLETNVIAPLGEIPIRALVCAVIFIVRECHLL